MPLVRLQIHLYWAPSQRCRCSRGHTWVVDGRDLGVSLQAAGQQHRRRVLLLHAQVESLQTAQHHPGGVRVDRPAQHVVHQPHRRYLASSRNNLSIYQWQSTTCAKLICTHHVVGVQTHDCQSAGAARYKHEEHLIIDDILHMAYEEAGTHQVLLAGEGAGHDVVVAGQVLGRRVDDQVRAQLQRTLRDHHRDFTWLSCS